MSVQHFSEFLPGRSGMTLHSHAQGLQSAQDQERVEGRERRAGEDPQSDAADAFDDLRGADDHASEQIAVSAQVLGRGMNDEARPKFERSLESRGGDALLMIVRAPTALARDAVPAMSITRRFGLAGVSK